MRSRKVIRTVLLLCAVARCVQPGLAAQKRGAPLRVLVLHWDNKDNPANIRFDSAFDAQLAASGMTDVEYYPEYLESNRFPGPDNALLLRNYLSQKYAGSHIDVVVTNSTAPLAFLLKFRADLFPDAPIVFAATERPAPELLKTGAGATGVVYVTGYRMTVDLARRLHPETQRVFVISGKYAADRSFETLARNELKNYDPRISFTYLTDLPLDELQAKLAGLPARSIVLYVWQQSRNPKGSLIQSQDVLARIAPAARSPIYGLSFANVGLGIVGGYVWTEDGNVSRLAEMTLRVANGTRAQDIPVETGPETAMFDWRQLQRWRIEENRLPPGSVVLFRQATMWQQYKWRIVAAVLVLALQALLISGLLVQRRRARIAHQALERHKNQLEDQVRKRTGELVEARDQAVAANRSKSMFLAKMSHELRTPLNAILGFSSMVLRDPNLADQHRKDLEIVGRSGEYLLRLIDDVLDIAKIESGTVLIESAATDVFTLVGDAVKMLRERAEAKSLEIRFDISPETPRFVRSDPGRLRQILINLIGNALKYTDVGAVQVRTNARPSDKDGSVILVFDVEDTGRGINEEEQDRIFDAFVQAGSKTGQKGVGLGLTISRQFVQLLGGTIEVSSKPGRGSRFHVEVPAELAAVAEATEVVANTKQVIALAPGQRNYRILVVEDEPENWDLLKRLMEAAGFDVQIAEDGGQAIEAFTSSRPDFIWMDLRLPVLDGMEATRRIRTLEGGGDVKIVAVTASAFDSQRDEVLTAGFDGFLRKPYRPREIFDHLARHLGARYIYGPEPQVAPDELVAMLRPSDLAAIPAALRDELERAVVSLDPNQIALVIGRVSEQDASLGRALRRLADQLVYTPILEALRASGRWAAAQAS